jgi:thiol:disulfide interchange protein
MNGLIRGTAMLAVLLFGAGCGDAPTTSPVKRAKTPDREKLREEEKPREPEKDPAPPPTKLHPFEQALARAKAEGKLLFVEFSAAWCGPCQQMKRDTFANSQVQARLAGYVTLFVDSDRDPGLCQQFGVRGIPAYFLVRPDRTVARSGAGYRGPGEFLRWLDGAR